jgi:FkbM family methyltransferase
MHPLNVVVDATALITSRLPRFRGLGTLTQRLNKVMLRLGAAPLSRARMRDGTVLRVDLRSYTEFQAKYLGVYDPRLIGLVKNVMDPAGDFLDVGANIGFYSVAMGASLKRAAQGGQVIAFEPHRDNFRRLLENITINSLDQTVRAHEVGLSNYMGHAELTLREDFAIGSSTGNAAIATNPEFDRGFTKVLIPLTKLDEIRGQFRDGGHRISFVKVDIEGHEDYFLEGAQETLNRARPTVLMEVNKPYYDARGVDLDARLLPLVPERYLILRSVDSLWRQIESLAECTELDNVILLPAEQLNSGRVVSFGSDGFRL